jgi:hypothetical protein
MACRTDHETLINRLRAAKERLALVSESSMAFVELVRIRLQHDAAPIIRVELDELMILRIQQHLDSAGVQIAATAERQ